MGWDSITRWGNADIVGARSVQAYIEEDVVGEQGV